MLGSAVASGITTGVDAVLTLSMNGTNIRVLVDGVVKISVTDSSLAGAGFPGLRFLANASNISLDDFSSTGYPSGGFNASWAKNSNSIFGAGA